MIQVKFIGNGFEYYEPIEYPKDIRIVGEGHSFWGYTPFDRFVAPMNGSIEISLTEES